MTRNGLGARMEFSSGSALAGARGHARPKGGTKLWHRSAALKSATIWSDSELTEHAASRVQRNTLQYKPEWEHQHHPQWVTGGTPTSTYHSLTKTQPASMPQPGQSHSSRLKLYMMRLRMAGPVRLPRQVAGRGLGRPSFRAKLLPDLGCSLDPSDCGFFLIDDKPHL